jgi:hypothetical protein
MLKAAGQCPSLDSMLHTALELNDEQSKQQLAYLLDQDQGRIDDKTFIHEFAHQNRLSHPHRHHDEQQDYVCPRTCTCTHPFERRFRTRTHIHTCRKDSSSQTWRDNISSVPNKSGCIHGFGRYCHWTALFNFVSLLHCVCWFVCLLRFVKSAK